MMGGAMAYPRDHPAHQYASIFNLAEDNLAYKWNMWRRKWVQGRTTWDDRFDWSMHPNHSIMSATLHSIFSLSFLNIDTEDLNITLMTEAELA